MKSSGLITHPLAAPSGWPGHLLQCREAHQGMLPLWCLRPLGPRSPFIGTHSDRVVAWISVTPHINEVRAQQPHALLQKDHMGSLDQILSLSLAVVAELLQSDVLLARSAG